MKRLSSLALLLIGHTSTLAMLAICRESARETDEERCSSESVLALVAFAVLEETALARSYLS
jgi:hypothetical protein